MPRKPLKPCRYPGCPKLTESAYCSEHGKLMNARYNHNQRNQEAQSFYNSSAWKKLRSRYILEHPFCVECWRRGKLNEASLVDHIVPISKGGDPLDERNLQSLCWSCHSSKSIKEGSRFGSR